MSIEHFYKVDLMHILYNIFVLMFRFITTQKIVKFVEGSKKEELKHGDLIGLHKD